jgi:hypothetical protein
MSAAYEKRLNDVCGRLGFCGSVADGQPLQSINSSLKSVL